MKIIKLQAENFKRLVAIEITPQGNVVELTGRNGSGKTSVLDALWVALAGLGSAPSKPIRTGQSEARIRLDLGEIVVTRTFRDKDGAATSTIRVENSEGAKFPSPQTMLDQLLGRLTFDPLAFARATPREQFDTLRSFVPGIDFDVLAKQDREDFEQRTAYNRKAKDAEAAANSIKIDPNLPKEAAGIEKLAADLEAAGKHNADIETRKANRARLAAEAAHDRQRALQFGKELDDLKARVVGLTEEVRQYAANADQIEAKLQAAPPLPLPIDPAGIRQQIANVQRYNAQFSERERRDTLRSEHDDYQQKADEISLRMDQREVQRREAVAAAKMPIDGLTFGDGNIIMNGEPFAQASDAEQLQASIAIAMAMNPKLRVIRVRDGSLLDDDSMRLLAEAAKGNDFQVWIERVDSSGKVGFVLEDGHIKTGAS